MILKHNMRDIEAVNGEALRLKNKRLASKERGEQGPGPSRHNPQRSQFRHDYCGSQKGWVGGDNNTNDGGEAIITLGAIPSLTPSKPSAALVTAPTRATRIGVSVKVRI